GLSAIRNVGEALVEQIVAHRRESGQYTSFYDFVERAPALINDSMVRLFNTCSGARSTKS
ncbi:MAG: hypothetical protein EBZ45_05100, partial [Actinobacteria bacterium]|nr:hypothetical protein [Actinomycetota bacterium]